MDTLIDYIFETTLRKYPILFSLRKWLGSKTSYSFPLAVLIFEDRALKSWLLGLFMFLKLKTQLKIFNITKFP